MGTDPEDESHERTRDLELCRSSRESIACGANTIKLKLNLSNAEATFGRESSQYFDILEIIENFMAKMGQDDEEPPESAVEHNSSPQTLNLAFRPKPR